MVIVLTGQLLKPRVFVRKEEKMFPKNEEKLYILLKSSSPQVVTDCPNAF